MAPSEMTRADVKQFAPAAQRNTPPIIVALTDVLPKRGLVLELASGTGQHAAAFAAAFAGLDWQPTDPSPSALASIRAHRAEAALPNLATPFELDARTDPWPVERCDAVLCINMIHIAPWDATLGLLRGAARVLPPGGPLILYGPYRIDGDWGAESNADFDLSLRCRDSSWGVRELREVEAAAREQAFTLDVLVPMPANNHVVVFRKR